MKTLINPNLERLQPYPFEKLRELVADVTPNPDLTALSLGIGEPQHPPPQVVTDALVANLDLVAKYPATLGTPEFRHTIAQWLTRRFKLTGIDADRQVIPVAGTREALFAIVQALVSPGQQIAMPNPFYQIYEGAALMAGAIHNIWPPRRTMTMCLNLIRSATSTPWVWSLSVLRATRRGECSASRNCKR